MSKPKVRVTPKHKRDRKLAKQLEQYLAAQPALTGDEAQMSVVLTVLYGPDKRHWPN